MRHRWPQVGEYDAGSLPERTTIASIWLGYLVPVTPSTLGHDKLGIRASRMPEKVHKPCLVDSCLWATLALDMVDQEIGMDPREVRMTYLVEDYARLYIQEIVRLRGVPLSIISDLRDQFTSHFWRSFQKDLGTQVNLSTTFHPQTDGQMVPYKALYGRKGRSPIDWFELREADFLGPNLVQRAIKKVKLIRDPLHTAQCREKSYADVRRWNIQFEVEYWVFLKVLPMKGIMRFEKKGKLSPRYVAPYKIIHKIGMVAYELDLHSELEAVHPVFHVSMLWKCSGDP
ncbi:hypothetical protein MTR67_002933 [Solanum verrucosum]|uniref:Tf2-1-like SH3-like domain-containing protein n=1 Tax=Solanum verrucosum TaxID=315347 RepID=A0AAF0T9X1_SOLVR|nr:hypothetical protein MTR67_002933 [Solanum verrucosum]